MTKRAVFTGSRPADLVFDWLPRWPARECGQKIHSVSTRPAQARRIADWAALFWKQGEAGRLIEHGAVRQIFEAPMQELTAAYIRGRRG